MILWDGQGAPDPRRVRIILAEKGHTVAARSDQQVRGHVPTQLVPAAAAVLAGQDALARETANRLQEIDPDFGVAALGPQPFRGPEHLQRLVDGRRQAGLPD